MAGASREPIGVARVGTSISSMRVVLLAVLLLAALPAGAGAQEAPRTDPEAGSPSEAIYGIPLEEARRDASPRPEPGSAIRSENGVGSSARVPGVELEAAARGRALAGDPSVGPKGEGRPGSRADGARRAPELAAAEAAPSAVGTWSLLVLTLFIGAGAGVVAGRRGRRA